MILSPQGAFKERSGLHAPTWWATEQEYCTIMYWAILANKYRSVLELGTFLGHTTWWFHEAVKTTGGMLTTVDLIKRPMPFQINLYYFDQVQSRTDDFWSDKKYDFIYVDAGHSFDEAYRDIVNAKAHLIKGGMIAVHDTSLKEDGIKVVREALEKAREKVGGSWMFFEQGKGLAIAEF